MAVTASDIREYATGGTQISAGRYSKGGNTPVAVMKKNGAVYWHSGMSIDCDGQPGSVCNSQTDPYFQPNTSWNQSDGKPLKAGELPFVVVPLPSAVWKFADHGIRGGDLVTMVYKDKVVHGVVGDQGPADRIGEGSYAAAKALGINPDPVSGGVGSGVTYVVYPGVKVNPIESSAEAHRLGEAKTAEWLGTTVVTPPTTPPDVEQTHVVQKGESLWSISQLYKMTLDELINMNGLVYPGQIVRVKPAVPPHPYATVLPAINSNLPSAVLLQKELKRVGYMAVGVVENANYGPKTQEAVVAFHNHHPEFVSAGGPKSQITREGWDFLVEANKATAMIGPDTTAVVRVQSPVPNYGVSTPFEPPNMGDNYGAPEGKPVVAVRDGQIVWANSNGQAFGNWIGLRADNNRDYVYCHLSNFHASVSPGAKVRAGEIIGYVGMTGNVTSPVLHFEDRPAGGGYGTSRKPTW